MQINSNGFNNSFKDISILNKSQLNIKNKDNSKLMTQLEEALNLQESSLIYKNFDYNSIVSILA